MEANEKKRRIAQQFRIFRDSGRMFFALLAGPISMMLA